MTMIEARTTAAGRTAARLLASLVALLVLPMMALPLTAQEARRAVPFQERAQALCGLGNRRLYDHEPDAGGSAGGRRGSRRGGCTASRICSWPAARCSRPAHSGPDADDRGAGAATGAAFSGSVPCEAAPGRGGRGPRAAQPHWPRRSSTRLALPTLRSIVFGATMLTSTDTPRASASRRRTRAASAPARPPLPAPLPAGSPPAPRGCRARARAARPGGSAGRAPASGGARAPPARDTR